jgi:hypothetical protein
MRSAAAQGSLRGAKTLLEKRKARNKEKKAKF